MSRFTVRSFGTTMQFDGATTKIVPTSSAFTNDENCAMCLWFKSTVDSADVAFQIPLIFTTFNEMYIRRTWNDVILRTDNGSAREVLFRLGTGNRGWHHVVGQLIQQGGTNCRQEIYVDGVLRNAQNLTALPVTSRTPTIGNFSTTNWFKGYMDEIAVYRRSLTATEISDMYYKGVVPLNSCAYYYKLNEGSGSTTTDSSGNSNSGTITGGTYSSEVPMTTRTLVS